jgi:hypothetical protein
MVRTHFRRKVKTWRVVVAVTFLFVAVGCAGSTTSQFSFEEWMKEIGTCVEAMEVQYPGANRAALVVVCESEYWSVRQDLLNDICSKNPEDSFCAFKK